MFHQNSPFLHCFLYCITSESLRIFLPFPHNFSPSYIVIFLIVCGFPSIHRKNFYRTAPTQLSVLATSLHLPTVDSCWPKRAFSGEARPLHDYGDFLFVKSNTVFPYVMDSPGLKLCDVFLVSICCKASLAQSNRSSKVFLVTFFPKEFMISVLYSLRISSFGILNA